MRRNRPIKAAVELPPIAAGGGKVTVKDIARAAGVSIATVSRVLNNPGLVTADKQEAVLEALRNHDYIPNQHARSLISRRSRVIGLVVPTLSNPVFAPTIAAIEREFDRAGYGLLIQCSERDPQRELAQVRTLIERGVDGLIITGSRNGLDLPALMLRNQVPHVWQDTSLDQPMEPSVAHDNIGALESAIDHLYAMGHREVAVFSGPTHNTPSIRDRVHGAITRIRHHGLDLPETWRVITEDYESRTIRSGACRLLDARRPPTAVALTGDVLALGLVAECRARGLSVPNDLSIIGCGDTDMGQYVDPPLTTVHMPFAEMGEAAARSLLTVISGQRPPMSVVLPHRLIIRQSVRAPRR